MKTKKLFAFFIAFAFAFSSCPAEPVDETTPDNNNNDNTDTSTIYIQNQSAATLVNIVWNGHSFSEGQAINPGGNTRVDNVKEGQGYIFFNIMGAGSDITLRTQALVSKDGQNLTFTFTTNTPIVKVSDESNVFTIGSFLNSINNPEGLYLPSHNEIVTALNAIGSGINNVRILSYQLMDNLLWKNVLSGTENETVNIARDSKINIEVGYTGAVSTEEVTKVLDNLFINFTSANIVVSGGMTFPLPTHLEIQQAVMALDGAGTTSDVVATDYLVNGSYIFDGYEIDRPYNAIIEITVKYTTTILTQARVRTEVTRIFATAGFNNVTVNAAHW